MTFFRETTELSENAMMALVWSLEIVAMYRLTKELSPDWIESEQSNHAATYLKNCPCCEIEAAVESVASCGVSGPIPCAI